MSILVGIPYHPRKRYALAHILDWVDNQTYQDVEVVMRWHTGPFGAHDAVKAQREFFRQTAEARGHDYFYSLGADTIPPLDALSRLVRANRDIIGLPYRQRKDSQQPAVIAWKNGDKEQKFMDGTITEVDGMGMDAVLFSRPAFTSFTFFDWPTIDDDGPAYAALKSSGFQIWLDTSQQCRHYMTADKFV